MANKLSVGDIVFNEWQGADNPTAYMVVVSISSKTINCITPTHKPGHIRQFNRDSKLKLRKIGDFDLSLFLGTVENWKNNLPPDSPFLN